MTPLKHENTAFSSEEHEGGFMSGTYVSNPKGYFVQVILEIDEISETENFSFTAGIIVEPTDFLDSSKKTATIRSYCKSSPDSLAAKLHQGIMEAQLMDSEESRKATSEIAYAAYKR